MAESRKFLAAQIEAIEEAEKAVLPLLTLEVYRLLSGAA